MIETEREGGRRLARLALPHLLGSLVYAGLVLLTEETLGDHLYKGAGQIGSVFGIALAFFLGFRMNAAHDRWWEARKVLGELTNVTRSFCCKVVTFCGNEENLREPFGRDRWVVVEKLLSMMQGYLGAFRAETVGVVEDGHAPASQRLLEISQEIERVVSPERPFEKLELSRHITALFDAQGKAERIRNTPFLKIYGAFARVIVTAYVLMIPMFVGDIDIGGEASHFEYLAMPLLAFLSTIFLTIHELANLHAEPFSRNATSLPTEAICDKLLAECESLRQGAVSQMSAV